MSNLVVGNITFNPNLLPPGGEKVIVDNGEPRGFLPYQRAWIMQDKPINHERLAKNSPTIFMMKARRGGCTEAVKAMLIINHLRDSFFRWFDEIWNTEWRRREKLSLSKCYKLAAAKFRQVFPGIEPPPFADVLARVRNDRGLHGRSRSSSAGGLKG